MGRPTIAEQRVNRAIAAKVENGQKGKLTARQEEILKFIRAFIDKRGSPPTRQEICDGFGFRSPNAADQHLRLIARKGYLQLLPGKIARGVVLSAE
jgi:repressor LexA